MEVAYISCGERERASNWCLLSSPRAPALEKSLFKGSWLGRDTERHRRIIKFYPLCCEENQAESEEIDSPEHRELPRLA